MPAINCMCMMAVITTLTEQTSETESYSIIIISFPISLTGSISTWCLCWCCCWTDSSHSDTSSAASNSPADCDTQNEMV